MCKWFMGEVLWNIFKLQNFFSEAPKRNILATKFPAGKAKRTNFEKCSLPEAKTRFQKQKGLVNFPFLLLKLTALRSVLVWKLWKLILMALEGKENFFLSKAHKFTMIVAEFLALIFVIFIHFLSAIFNNRRSLLPPVVDEIINFFPIRLISVLRRFFRRHGFLAFSFCRSLDFHRFFVHEQNKKLCLIFLHRVIYSLGFWTGYTMWVYNEKMNRQKRTSPKGLSFNSKN